MYGHMLLFPLTKFLDMRWLGHMVGNIEETAKLLCTPYVCSLIACVTPQITISMSSLVKHLLNHLPIFCLWMFVFLLLSFNSSLYIVDKSHLSGRLFANICSQCLSCLVILLTVSFREQFLILKKSSLSSFPFVIMLSTLFQRNICLT